MPESFNNFWKKLPKPFLVLAPMEGVTECALREMLTTTSPPDVYFTEFTNADGLVFDKKGRVIRKLKFTEKQRPIVAQIWGKRPETLERAAKLVQDMGFDGVDINMGCPEVVKSGAGAALIKTPEVAKVVIEAVKRGAPNLPVSVKTRLGYDKIITKEWLSFLLKQDLAAISIHARTTKQLSHGTAKWEEIGKIVKLRDTIAPQTLIIGNGDIKSFTQASEMVDKYGVDGVMIGRGIFKNPYVFDKKDPHQNLTKQERIDLTLRHIEIFQKIWEGNADFDSLKKFIKTYIKGFRGSKELRMSLMACKAPEEAIRFLTNNPPLI